MIGFNKPYISGKEFEYIQEAIKIEKLSGNGFFTKRCHEFFEKRYGFRKCLLTHSCTAALEMAAILIDIKPGDEVIIPSYTFVSTANAFLLRGAKIVFADSQQHHPNIDPTHVETLITGKTKAIVVVHYAGVACDMDPIMDLAQEHDLFVIEDAAQAIDSFYKGRPLGSIGHLAAFSFHETKNIIAGEGGMLVVNDEQFLERSEIIWEKGTNRAAFSRGEVQKYRWVDIGSSFLPSELTAAFLFAQLEKLDFIQEKRKSNWSYYFEKLSPLQDAGKIKLPKINSSATNNAHVFYLLSKNVEERNDVISHLHSSGIQAIFHYLALHESPFFLANNYRANYLPCSSYFTNCLLRLPLFIELNKDEMNTVAKKLFEFYDDVKL
jgi:dTDP-4-amino-4,6-dideoxygalactose transaminase